MKLTIERLPESRVQLEITAEEEESAEAMRRAARKVGNQITVPGFRKGKAPKAMIERLYGPDIFEEEANRFLMTDLYRQALEREELVPVGEPEVDITSTVPLSYTVVVPVYPTADPGDYRVVRVEPVDASVSEAEVEETMETLRRAQSPWADPAGEGLEVGAGLELRPKSRYPRVGDQVTIDYTVQEDGKDVEEPVTDAVFVVGESGLLQTVEDAIKGLRVGESTQFTLSFAEDDETADKSVRGKDLNYAVTLKGLKERDLVPLDDDFAKKVGDVDTLEELRRTIRENLHRQRTATARSEVLAQIVSKIAEGATVDLPASMVDEAVDDDVHRLRNSLAQQGLSLEAYLRATESGEEELRAELRPDAQDRLRNILLLRAVAEREAIAVDDDAVDAAVARMTQYAQEAQQPKQAEAFARSPRVRSALQNDMFERQLTDRLIELATEGRGAVINAWESPATAPEVTAEAVEEALDNEELAAAASVPEAGVDDRGAS